MLGRAVQLTCWHQSEGEENITNSASAEHYLIRCLHSSDSSEVDLPTMRELNRQGRYLWGDYIGMRIQPPPDVRVLNLESAITESIRNPDVPSDKAINYHFHSQNLDEAMQAYRDERHGGEQSTPVVLSLANNHVLDFGRRAFEEETLPLVKSEWLVIGVGYTFSEAARPVKLRIRNSLLHIYAMATGCSGTSSEWAATNRQSGVFWLPALTHPKAVDNAVRMFKHALALEPSTSPEKPLNLVSIHWGPNWAYRQGVMADAQAYRVALAHRLIDECGVDIIYGHSSHHVRGLERHNGKLIIYGAGDLINDYEGFENPGDELYVRTGALFVVDIAETDGMLEQVRLVPMYMDRLRLRRLQSNAAVWSPRNAELITNPRAPKEFLDFVNRMSRLDSGRSLDALNLTLVEEDPQIPDGPVLTFSS